MAFEFRLPDIGEGLAEATVVSWLVAVGDEVTADQPLVEMETDKAITDIPAPQAGTVLFLGGANGEVIEVGEILVVIGEPGEVWDQPVSPSPPAEAAPTTAAPIVGSLSEGDGPDIQALPAVRRLASELGVDLSSVTGTGPGGRITKADVEAATGDSGDVERVRLSATRLAIARNMTRSWQEIPHVTTYASADALPLLGARSDLVEAGGSPIPLEALLMSRIAPLLAEHPAFNASLDGEYIILKRHYDIGFAVDSPDGLMVAVVRDVPSKSVEELGAEILILARSVRDRTAGVEDLRGATFTISNIGAVGGRYGTPIIPHGTTSIVSIGRADPAPLVRDGRVVAAREFPLSVSYDHRVIDGAAGRAFVADLVVALARP